MNKKRTFYFLFEWKKINIFWKKCVHFHFCAVYCTTTETKNTICVIKGVKTMSMKSPMEFFRTLPKKTCPECGEQVEEQAESYFMECERCLAKKGE